MDRPKATSLPPDLSGVALYESTHAQEIGIKDVWLALVRRKLIIAAVVVVSVAFGGVYALTTPHSYTYTTIVEVGTRYTVGRNGSVGQVELIEAPETVRIKVVNAYIPQVLQTRVKDTSNDASRYDVNAEVPKNSQVLVLRSRGMVEDEPVYSALHAAVVERLRLDHLRMQNVLRKDLEARLEIQERNVAELREQARLFEVQLKRLEGKRELPARELSYLTSLRLADNQRAQSEMVPLIDSARQQLANMRETGAVVSPVRSLDPVGLGKTTFVMLAGFVGLFFGIILALSVDFVIRAREQAEA